MDKQFFIVSLKDIFSLVTLLLKLLFPLLLRTVSGLIPLIVFKTAGKVSKLWNNFNLCVLTL